MPVAPPRTNSRLGGHACDGEVALRWCAISTFKDCGIANRSNPCVRCHTQGDGGAQNTTRAPITRTWPALTNASKSASNCCVCFARSFRTTGGNSGCVTPVVSNVAGSWRVRVATVRHHATTSNSAAIPTWAAIRGAMRCFVSAKALQSTVWGTSPAWSHW